MPEDSLAAYRGRFPETPFVNRAADGYTPVPPFKRTGYRSQPEPHAAFAAMVARMDRDIGRLMATLSRLGRDKDTLVLFTSDNGAHREGGADRHSSTAREGCAASSATSTRAATVSR